MNNQKKSQPKRNKKRDERVLIKIAGRQQELLDELKHSKISKHEDLNKLRPIVRGGIIFHVGVIHELIKELSDSTADTLNIKRAYFKDFRDKLSHNYGRINNIEAMAYIQYCIRPDALSSIKKALKDVEEHNRKKEEQEKTNGKNLD